MNDFQDPADDLFLERLRAFLDPVPDGFDDLALKAVREQVRRSSQESAAERSSGDSTG